MSKEAMFYDKKDGLAVECFLCNHRCKIANGKSGICQVRQNVDGKLLALSYGKVVSTNLDPIEKKPFFHMLPGSNSFSIASVGCNFHCGFCQNWEISQAGEAARLKIESRDFAPEAVVSRAQECGAGSISCTYTEPTVFFEYAYDVAKAAEQKGIYVNLVTNGYMTPQAIEVIRPYLDACNVDLKGFSEEFYQNVCGAHLEPLLESIRTMKKLGLWLEITTLLIPGMNDSDEELTKIAEFICGLGKETPWHISRFHPDFKYVNLPPTPLASLQKAAEIGRKAGLYYVYIGNASGGEGEDTYCYECKKPVIKRMGYSILDYKLKGYKCGYCGATIHGIFD
ncbi:MAG: AmmeMemoRadiSam system radical SAM enzyme [Candidatus Omnitrophota bacterium]